MKKLYMGTDAIAIKDAALKLQKSIEDLTIKKRKVNLNGYAGKQINRLYEERIQSQLAILDWLKKAI